MREYMETPFWQAWYSIVAEQAALEDIEIAEGEFGDHELFRVSPLGDRVAISTPEEALKFIPKRLESLFGAGSSSSRTSASADTGQEHRRPTFS